MIAPPHAGCPWTGPCRCTRDAAPCTCGHVGVSHGHGWDLEKQPARSRIGAGSCGYCDCTVFVPRPADWWQSTTLQPLFDEWLERSTA